MSRDAGLTLDWADGTYPFRLRYGELIELQEKTDAGPGWVLQRLMMPSAENRGWRVGDIATIIRLGLIGGGMKPVDAMKLTRDYVEARPPMENLLVAQTILSAALVGAPDEEKKSPAEMESGSTISPEANGDSEPSSEPERPSGSRRGTSRSAPSGS